MEDYAQELLNDSLSAPSMETPKQRDYATEMFSVGEPEPSTPKIQRHFVETDEMDAITGKKKLKFTGEGGPGASYWAHVKAGFVDDPITKMKIYAADRFPQLTLSQQLERYNIVEGEIVYEGDDGKLYSEAPDMFHNKLKRFLGETTANLPADVGATAGAVVGGIPGAVAGGMAGELVRKSVGGLVFDEKQDIMDYTTDLTLTGGLAAVGAGTGSVAARKTSKTMATVTGGRKGRRLSKLLGDQIYSLDFKKAGKIHKRILDEFGVDLFDAQTTESQRLLNKISLYGDVPDLADVVQSAKRIQNEQAMRAVDDFWTYIHDIGDNASDLYDVGDKVVNSADRIIRKKIMSASRKATPYYNKAFSKNIQVDTGPHIQELDKAIKAWPETSAERKKLEGFRRMLLRTVEVDGKEVMVPESRMKVLDRLKKSVDSYLKPSPSDAPVAREVKMEIRKVKNNILADMDKLSPDYQKARQIFGDDADAVKRITNKTVLSNIASLEGDRVVGASRKLFQTVGNSPSIMRKARREMMADNPDVYNSALRVYLEDIWGRIKKPIGDSTKEFSGFWRATAGDKRQARILKEAMSPEQWKRFEDFSEMLRRVSLIAVKESKTATRQLEMAQEKSMGNLAFRAYAYPLFTWKKLVVDKVQTLQSAKNRAKLLNALIDPRSGRELSKIKKLGVGTAAGMRALGTFSTMVIGGEYLRNGNELYNQTFQSH
jgi:hypothetical protein